MLTVTDDDGHTGQTSQLITLLAAPDGLAAEVEEHCRQVRAGDRRGVAKAITLLVVLVMRSIETKLRLHRFIDSISKWSMADVFLVGVYVAFLSAKATDNLDAEIHQGFYYFAAYCLVSIASLHFMRFDRKQLQGQIER